METHGIVVRQLSWNRVHPLPPSSPTVVMGCLKSKGFRTTLLLLSLFLSTAATNELNLLSSGPLRQNVESASVETSVEVGNEMATESARASMTTLTSTLFPYLAGTTTTISTVHIMPTVSSTKPHARRYPALRNSAAVGVGFAELPERSSTPEPEQLKESTTTAASPLEPPLVAYSPSSSVISPVPTQEEPTRWPSGQPLSGQAVPHWPTTATPPVQSGSPQQARSPRAFQQGGGFALSSQLMPMPRSMPNLFPRVPLAGHHRAGVSGPRTVWPAASSIRQWFLQEFDGIGR